jgi:hypothetical protein
MPQAGLGPAFRAAFVHPFSTKSGTYRRHPEAVLLSCEVEGSRDGARVDGHDSGGTFGGTRRSLDGDPTHVLPRAGRFTRFK